MGGEVSEARRTTDLQEQLLVQTPKTNVAELERSMPDTITFESVPGHEGDISAIVERYGGDVSTCPYIRSMGAAGVKLVENLIEAEKNPERGPTLKDLLIAKKEQSITQPETKQKPVEKETTEQLGKSADSLVASKPTIDFKVDNLTIEAAQREIHKTNSNTTHETTDEVARALKQRLSGWDQTARHQLSEEYYHFPREVILRTQKSLTTSSKPVQHKIRKRFDIEQTKKPWLAKEISTTRKKLEATLLEIMPTSNQQENELLNANSAEDGPEFSIDTSSGFETPLNIQAAEIAEENPQRDWVELLRREADTDLYFIQADSEQLDIVDERIQIVENSAESTFESTLFNLLDAEFLGKQGYMPSLLIEQIAEPEQNSPDNDVASSKIADEEALHKHIQTLSETKRALSIEIFEDITRLTAVANQTEETPKNQAELREKLEVLCKLLFDVIGFDLQEDMIQHIVNDILELQQTKTLENSEFSIENLNEMGTNEYKIQLVSKINAHLITLANKKIQLMLGLGKYILEAIIGRGSLPLTITS